MISSNEKKSYVNEAEITNPEYQRSYQIILHRILHPDDIDLPKPEDDWLQPFLVSNELKYKASDTWSELESAFKTIKSWSIWLRLDLMSIVWKSKSLKKADATTLYAKDDTLIDVDALLSRADDTLPISENNTSDHSIKGRMLASLQKGDPITEFEQILNEPGDNIFEGLKL